MSMTVFFGILLIAFSAWAGILKDKHVSTAKKQESIGEFSLMKGSWAAVLVGITGSAMSLGFEKGLPISDEAAGQGVNPLFTMMPVRLVLLAGTFVTTVIWCLFLGYRNKSLKEWKFSRKAVVLFLTPTITFYPMYRLKI